MSKPKKATIGVKDKIIKTYAELSKKNGHPPTRQELLKAGYSRDTIRYHFGGYEVLRDLAKDKFPKLMKEAIVTDELFSPEALAAIQDSVKNYSRFVITTAVTGCIPHKGFLASIKNYCSVNNAALLVLSCTDPAAANASGFGIHSSLLDEMIIAKDVALNSNVFVSTIKLSAKHIDPITGLSRLGKRNGSFIYGSPKQRLKLTATSSTKLPHAIMTTGAVTRPNYDTDRYMSGRTAYIADYDHVIGAIVVEVENSEIFHYRQVQANKSGHFADLGKLYTPTDVKDYSPELLVLGDYHSGETDLSAKSAFLTGENSLAALLKPNKAVIHDGFNGHSISHHEAKSRALKAQRHERGELGLEKELKHLAKEINEIGPLFSGGLVWVRSNHDEHLDRYLDEAAYIYDPCNYKISLKLAQAMADGQNPVRAGIEALGLDPSLKIKWLSRDEDFKVAGIECGSHGDRGSNGSRASTKGMEEAFGLSVSGHSHTPEILRGAWVVGTLSKLKLEYNKGASSWMHTSCLVYPNGMRQLINSIDGKYRLED